MSLRLFALFEALSLLVAAPAAAKELCANSSGGEIWAAISCDSV
jgi:hypothetical protein